MSLRELENFRKTIGFRDVKDQLKNYIYSRSQAAFDRGYAHRDAIVDKESMERRVCLMGARFVQAMGGLPVSDTPLNPVVAGAVAEDGFHIENVMYNSRPNVYVTANIYIPDGIVEPVGAVLFLSGHHDEARLSDEYQAVCRRLACAGLVVLAPDPVGQGERWSYWERGLGAATVHCGVADHDYAGIQCLPLGDTIARYFLHDAMRSIDYLTTRPEVDPSRIGVTGNSGGGTQTSLMMVCDGRVAAYAPATFLMNRESYLYTGQAQDCEQIWSGMTALGFDHEDILLMAAPKPVLVLAVHDDYFPIEGTRMTVDRCRRFWEICGHPGGLELFEDNAAHMYTPAMADQAARFFSLHLNGRVLPPDSPAVTPIPHRALWCVKSGQVRGEIAGAVGVHEENAGRLRALEAKRADADDDALREDTRQWLRGQVFANRVPVGKYDAGMRVWRNGNENELLYAVCYWLSQSGMAGTAAVLRHMNDREKKLPLTIALWPDGTADLARHTDWIRKTCESGRAVMALDVSGTGALEPNLVNARDIHAPYGTLYRFSNDLIWLGDSLPSLRAYEIIRALDTVLAFRGDIDASDIRLYAEGRSAVPVLIAAFIDRRFRLVEEKDAFEGFAAFIRARHYNSEGIMEIMVPGILQRCDLPDIRRWIGQDRRNNI